MNGSLMEALEKENTKYKFYNELCIKKGEPHKCKNSGLPEKEVRLYFIDMLKAIHYCHNVIHVAHRDIKPDNIMLNHRNEAVLIDFGISALTDEKAEGDMQNCTVGTYNYYSP
mmetsp:Transcript_10819/g.16441  ORF Transcript_10819/g.16441 Transcript_10819/m.16441 type:complete len:113 (+) Transcript_10819:420-758(+)